jgi:hypothetical protein
MAAAAVLFLSAAPALAAMPQTVDSPAAREAAARTLFGQIMGEAGVGPLREIRAMFGESGVSEAERIALEESFDAEIAVLLGQMEGHVAVVVARHVPLEQIRADADFNSPEWLAAGEEMSAWAERTGVELVMRVSEKGCVVEATPSPACVYILGRVGDYRSGRVSMGEVLSQ